jgi:hypothetical protein
LRNTDYKDKNYKKCLICGIPVKIDRDSFTGYLNIGIHESIVENNPEETGNTLLDINEDMTLPKESYDGSENNFSRVTYYTTVNSGCPFCGNSNKNKLKK